MPRSVVRQWNFNHFPVSITITVTDKNGTQKKSSQKKDSFHFLCRDRYYRFAFEHRFYFSSMVDNRFCVCERRYYIKKRVSRCYLVFIFFIQWKRAIFEFGRLLKFQLIECIKRGMRVWVSEWVSGCVELNWSVIFTCEMNENSLTAAILKNSHHSAKKNIYMMR